MTTFRQTDLGAELSLMFKPPLVRAILAGTKTQTRRVVVHQKIDAPTPFRVGRRIWVREPWQVLLGDDAEAARRSPVVPRKIPRERDARTFVAYAATDPQADATKAERGFSWRTPLFMPRWAARIELEVVGCGVERLQDITEESALAEGVAVGEMVPALVNGEPGRAAFFSARDAFAALWAGINGPESWRANPWVWAVRFRRLVPS